MRRRKGNLMGRYVSAHLRKSRSRPGEYDAVSAYQERVKATPSKTISPPLQYELNFEVSPIRLFSIADRYLLTVFSTEPSLMTANSSIRNEYSEVWCR